MATDTTYDNLIKMLENKLSRQQKAVEQTAKELEGAKALKAKQGELLKK